MVDLTEQVEALETQREEHTLCILPGNELAASSLNTQIDDLLCIVEDMRYDDFSRQNCLHQARARVLDLHSLTQE